VSVYVVDASVVIKWFVPEVHSKAALRLLDQPYQYVAPDLLFAEVGNVIWKKVRGGQLLLEEGEQLTRDLNNVAVETIPCRGLLGDAYSLAIATGRTVYDAMYLALAIRLDTQMITADERLANALAAIPAAAGYVMSIKNV